jgi:hypothetical protein
MTISNRNKLFGFGIVFSFIALGLLSAALVFCWKAIPDFVSQAAFRGLNLPSLPIFGQSALAACASLCACVVFALVVQIVIYCYFEKTWSTEILLVSLFVLSFSFEAGRAMLPVSEVFSLSGAYTIFATRFVVFGRCFGMFCLFAAGLYSTGLQAQNQGIVIFSLVVVAAMLTLRLPIDNLAWSTALMPLPAFMPLITTLGLLCAFLCAVSFFVSALQRGAKEFVFAGIGALLAFCGRGLLLNADTLFVAVPALVVLLFGLVMLCGRLHRLYVWI